MSSDAGSSRASSAIARSSHPGDESLDLHQIISATAGRPVTRDIREPRVPSNVIQLSDIRTGQPNSTGARPSDSRSAKPASSVGGSEVVNFNAPNLAVSSAPDDASVDSNLLRDLEDFADGANTDAVLTSEEGENMDIDDQ